jgi:hypothetical protein
VARVVIVGLIGIILVVTVARNMSESEDDAASSSAERGMGRITLTEYELLSRAERLEGLAYWVGRRPGVDHFELEREAGGNLYLRYLPNQSLTGDRRSETLTVASYPVAEARQLLGHAARAKGVELSRHNGFVMLGSDKSHNAYIVFDEVPELQVEIYAPQRGEAVKLAVSGVLTPLHWTPLD